MNPYLPSYCSSTKMALVLNNPRRLICHYANKPNLSKPSYPYMCFNRGISRHTISFDRQSFKDLSRCKSFRIFPDGMTHSDFAFQLTRSARHNCVRRVQIHLVHLGDIAVNSNKDAKEEEEEEENIK